MSEIRKEKKETKTKIWTLNNVNTLTKAHKAHLKYSKKK